MGKENEHYLKIVEDIEDYAILLLDKDGNIASWNKGASFIKGYSKEEISGKNFRIFYTIEDRDALLPETLLSTATTTGKAKHEGWRVRKDGKLFWSSVVITALHDDMDNLSGFMKITQDLTKYKATEEQLQKFNNELEHKINERTKELNQSNHEMQQLLDNTDDNFMIVDSLLNVISFNKKAKEHTEKFIGKKLVKGSSVFEYMDSHRIPVLLEMFNEVKTGLLRETEIKYLDEAGDEHFFLNKIRLVSETGGLNACIFITRLDITKQKKAEQKIKDSENRFLAFMNALPSATWVVDEHGRYIYVNNAFTRKFTITQEDCIGKTASEIIVGEQGQLFNKNTIEAINSGNILDHTIETKNADGENQYWHSIKFPFQNASGATMVGGIALDITKRKKTEDELKQSEHIRSLIVNAAMDAIMCMDEQGTIISWNKQAEQIFGWTEREIMGKKITETVIPEQHRNRFSKGMKNYFSVGVGAKLNEYIEDIAIRKNGDEFPVEITVLEIRENGLTNYCAFLKDISERRKAEQLILNTNRLYAFISQINQTIVQVRDEQTLFDEACRIATEVGKFELAWISIPDVTSKKLNIVAHSNATTGDLEILRNITYKDDGPIGNVIATNNLYIINNFQDKSVDDKFSRYAETRGFRSCIVLPILKNGKTRAAYNLVSSRLNLFDDEEIRLLKEATKDISFALDVFDKEKFRIEIGQKLADSERRLKQAQHMARFGSWERYFDTGTTIWSEEACSIYGLSINERKQSHENWLSFIHPDDLEYTLKVNEVARTNLSDCSYYHRIILRDGSIKHIHSQTQFEFDKNGKPIGIFGTFQDVSETKETEKALEQSEVNLRKILDLILQGVFAKTIDGDFVFVNKSFAAMYNQQPEDLINRNILEKINKTEEAVKYSKEDVEVIKTGCTKIIPDSKFTKPDGNERILHTIKVPFTPTGTNVEAVLGITNDITEQRIAEKERSKMIADIIQHNKDLEQFSYIISHNLRAPVANIMGITNILAEIHIDQDRQKKMLNLLSTSVANLDNVIKDLNNVLQVKHQVNEQKETVVFSKLVADIKLSIESLLRKEDVHFITNFSAVGEMAGLKSYLYSIFYNLILNSIKYKQHSQPCIIEIFSYKNGNNILLVFKDNGLGIDLKRGGKQIFGLYKRFHTHTEGKGIGLFMVKTQVESMNGKISVTSEVNKGTEFRIEFELN